eukprot:1140112-Prymnesium_polylepis.2
MFMFASAPAPPVPVPSLPSLQQGLLPTVRQVSDSYRVNSTRNAYRTRTRDREPTATRRARDRREPCARKA